ncbi:hypothetical protein BT69DRAFT_1323013 [Atractiella rhizophila]|nr:hypothetical protein BT69DRAFT_1323013 [Atractiella rhizophila]
MGSPSGKLSSRAILNNVRQIRVSCPQFFCFCLPILQPDDFGGKKVLDGVSQPLHTRNLVARKVDTQNSSEHLNRTIPQMKVVDQWEVNKNIRSLPAEVTLSLFVYDLHNFQKSDERRFEAVDCKLKNYLNIFNEPLYSDVAFVFHHGHEQSMQLFSSVALLAGCSEYFRDMFSSTGFAESLSTTQNTSYLGDHSETTEVDSDDSDIERDEVPKPLMREASTFKFVNIHHTCYSTYRAAIYYLLSNEIRFAPLKSHEDARKILEATAEWKKGKSVSNLPQAGGSADSSAPSILTIEAECLTADPLAASPKSIFKLAQAYGVESLKNLATKNILSQLTPHNALLELHSRFSDTYDEVRQIYMQYLVENWADVCNSPVACHVMEQHGSLPYSLVKELLEATSQKDIGDSTLLTPRHPAMSWVPSFRVAVNRVPDGGEPRTKVLDDI